MSELLKIPSNREPVFFVNPQTSLPSFTRPWFLFFQTIFERLGGSTSDGIDGVYEALAGAAASPSTVQQQGVGIEELRAELTSLINSRCDMLSRQIEEAIETARMDVPSLSLLQRQVTELQDRLL